AERLYQAEKVGSPCAPVRTEIPAGDLASAYAVQRINVDRAIKAGRRPVGRKIGLTSKVVQTQLGVDQPDFGYVFADMVVGDSEEIAFSHVLQPKVEAEIALMLEHDLTIENPTVADIINATAYALPAIEVVGSRVKNWDISILDTIADNASSGMIVLGDSPTKLEDLNLRLCGMAMEEGGDIVSVGAGVACLGSPLNAARWLANTMVNLGQPLKAGDIVMTGALGPMVNVKPGACYDVRISGLGSVRAVFGE
ncbi:MAG: fumarylacetoacetate hydrolase family protein, partial [Kordiimonadaceae bacterium]|nr:fumarylacetoacetate hydrolase family protein [Kordiimonadaceae bacterium]